MITFFLAIVLLVVAYFVYGKIVEKIFGIDTQRPTPAITKADGVDYVPMKPWRIFLIQFLNIAGVGPICGAIMGAQFGTASFLWIVFGSIFAGAVHDFIAGMISLRNDGCSLPEIHGKYLGNGVKQIMRAFTILLMILVGAVFVNTPAVLLNTNFTSDWNIYIWIGIIFAYYLIATLLPIDKLIGKLYPVFGILLVAMAVAILIAFFHYRPEMPELWHGLSNKHPHADTNPIFPMMFISIACGAISGFHATQSPLMARCMVNEKQGRPIFYGAMITEGVVALIWAAAATVFYHNPELQSLTVNPATGQQFGGNAMVGIIANRWFPPVVATITIIGVISAAITSGDTALRSARLIVADFLKYDQKPIKNRLFISIPIFLLTAGLLVFSLTDEKGFDVIWRYFAWSNQVLATVTLWAITIYLAKNKKIFVITLIPALFMTMVCSTFILISQSGGLGLKPIWAYSISGLITLGATVVFVFWLVKHRKQNIKTEKE
ncbi:MAG: carbon starvation protein A [Bacteroidales bacterium]|nr:carbon starvation protein A [Bacteroidales bacterium]